MGNQAKKRSLFIGLGAVFGIAVVAFLAALLALAINVQRTQLKKEAAVVSQEVITFQEWVIGTPNAKNHVTVAKDFSQVHSETLKENTFRVVYINTPDKLEEFDSNALNLFKQDKNLEYVDIFDAGTYKYARPMKMTEGCLKCHSNYKAGEYAGIIAVDIPKAAVLPPIELRGIATYFTIIAALIALLFNFIWFKSRIIRPLGSIDTTLKNVREGNYDARINITTKDEFGDIAETFNSTMDRLITLIQTDEERKQMQQNIFKFLETLSAASEGDLTKRSEVTPDVFGSLGDAFNMMVDGLSELIEKVKGSVGELNNESIRMIQVLKELESGASSQMLQVKRATESVNEAAMSASEITDKAKIAEEISINASKAIIKGSKAVESSIEGVQLIRLTIQAINKRMKYLSERLMEIVTISHLINEIANRTNILAINASIEATRAGEQGKGFVVISDEIRSLAEKAGKSTKQITEIINAVQTESAVVTKHLEEETKYVEIGTKMAADTEAAFREIEKTIKDTGVIISEISTSAEGQKKLTSDVVLSMDEVQMVSLQVLKLVQDFTEISKSLTDTSNVMISSAEKFKLPEKDIVEEDEKEQE